MEQQQSEKKHKRRVRYKGTHPRRFEEKYKELNPEKYGDTIQKVISKGSTPAGMHISICVKEILEFFDIQPGQKGLDATLGYGGHTRKMLEKLQGKGHIYALDVDPIESVKTEKRLHDAGFGEDILTIKHINFANIDQVAEEVGPLDLRLNPEKGISAAERLEDITKAEFEGMLIENADEPYAKQIAKETVATMKRGKKIKTTTDLKDVIERALNFLPEKERKEAVKKSCQRTFQALRIDVNSEFEVLEELLEKLPDALAPGGKVAILTFHSGEDRLVKHAFKYGKKIGIYSDVAKDVIRPSKEECAQNGRAKSTKMRWAIKVK